MKSIAIVLEEIEDDLHSFWADNPTKDPKRIEICPILWKNEAPSVAYITGMWMGIPVRPRLYLNDGEFKLITE